MAKRRTITISIAPEQHELLRAMLASGRYASVSDVVRAALRLSERDENATRPAARGTCA